MNLHILSEKPENSSTCYLCQTTLEEYLSYLPADYDKFTLSSIGKNKAG